MFTRLLKVLSALLFALVAGITLAAPAQAFSTDDAFETRARHNTAQPVMALVDYVGTTRVDVRMYLSDRPGDAYCAAGYAKLLNAQFQQLGNTITIGTVCSGRTAWTPDKVITTGAGQIEYVEVFFDNALSHGRCIRGSDGPEVCR
ncbi:hypothetical protein [Blastococcus sp. CT_GayMR19]|uniref:hypothetical protein n=1 Tax=Blastococcus sp. CT_GayMR19 TaxID=2559608 RepID=UPI00142FE0C1|nr:hypothetical protein [Blastococcus sp. CT_GayMR19]